MNFTYRKINFHTLKNYGLIGYPLSHSFSERYFAEKFYTLGIDAKYRNYELHDLDALPEIIQLHQLNGFNVTIPYKEKVLHYLDLIDETAKKIGAVNCVKVDQGKLKGYNTDIIGFEKSLHAFIDSKEMKALVFGNGGSSKAVKYVLQKLKIPFQSVSRNEIKGSITYSDLTESIFKDYHLLINTTPVGMFPHTQDMLPLPYHFIDENYFAFDLIYNPEKTAFLRRCEDEGAQIKNGYEMLVLQAEAAFSIFSSE